MTFYNFYNRSKFHNLWPGLCECSDLKDLLIVFQTECRGARCLIVYICQIKSTCSVSSPGPLTMPLTFSLTPTVFQVAGCSNSQSWSPGDAGCVQWLTLLPPNLWQAQGPLYPCDTLLPKLNPLLYFLVCDVIALGTTTPRRTPILFSFPAIKHYVWAHFSIGSQNVFSGFEVNTGIHQRRSPQRM